jgi:DNA polymerase-1
MTSIAALLAATRDTGAGFRLWGQDVLVTQSSLLSPELRDELGYRGGELWDHLGGAALDQPSLDLLARLGVEIVVPRTLAEAQAALAEIEADSNAHTPQDLRGLPGLIGLDTETMALPGMEDRPVVKLRKDGQPYKRQPALGSDAALDPHRSKIRLVQLYGGGARCLVLDTTLVPIEVIGPALRRRTAVIHNASFELRHLAAVGIEVPYFEDTMQASGLLLGVHRRALDDAALAYLGIELPKGLQRSDWSAPNLSAGQLAYAALDPIVTFQVWLKLRVELHAKGRGWAYLLQRDVTPAVARLMARGVQLDLAVHSAMIARWSVMLADARTDFVAATGEAPPDQPAQVRNYLDRVLPDTLKAGWQRTKQGELSIRASLLRRVAHLPEIRALLSISALEKLLSAFGTTLQSKLSTVTGRLHPSYNIAAAKTGRFSSSNPNVQQLPKKSSLEFRDAIATAAGTVLVVGDFHLMELRGAAAISGDPRMNADFTGGIDLHRQQAAAMLGIAYDAVTADQRDHAKPVNFSMTYGAGAAGIMATAWTNYGVVLTLEEAERARQAFLTRYAGYANWMRVNHVQCTTSGFIRIGRLGRVIEAAWEAKADRTSRGVTWRDDDDDYDDDLAAGYDDAVAWGHGWAEDSLKYTLCCNAPVQGACADAAMLALIKVDQALRAAGIDGGPVLFIHDEIVLEVGADQAEQARAILAACMTAAFAETFPGAPLNGVVSTGIGPTWGSAKP